MARKTVKQRFLSGGDKRQKNSTTEESLLVTTRSREITPGRDKGQKNSKTERCLPGGGDKGQ